MVEKAAAKNLLREVAAKRATEEADANQEDLEGAVQEAAGFLRTLLSSEKMFRKLSLLGRWRPEKLPLPGLLREKLPLPGRPKELMEMLAVQKRW